METQIPYDPSLLSWNELHTVNESHQYCYCGRDRDLSKLELQCQSCLNWFHDDCLSVSLGPVLPFITNYRFVCRMCSPSHEESFERLRAGWKEICATAVANQLLEHLLEDNRSNSSVVKHSLYADRWAEELNPGQYWFNKKDNFVPFVDRNWKALCTERSRTSTWWATLGSCLYSSKDLFEARDEGNRSAASDFRLFNPNLWEFRPIYNPNVLPRGYHPGRPQREPKRKSESAADSIGQASSKRQIKRSPSVAAQTPSSASTPPQYLQTTFTSSQEHPFNTNRFRYNFAVPNPLMPHVPYRLPDSRNGLTLSLEDRCTGIRYNRDMTTAMGEKGFRMARATCGVQEGRWYFEVFIDKGGGEGETKNSRTGAHVRLGFARREASLNAPVGFDAYSYGVRDSTGERVFCSRLSRFCEPFRTGDVIGVYISLPPSGYQRKTPIPELGRGRGQFKKPANKFASSSAATQQGASALRQRIPINFKGLVYFEERNYIASKQMEELSQPPLSTLTGYRPDWEKKQLNGSGGDEALKPWEATDTNALLSRLPSDLARIPGSKIIIYKNGKCQGTAFEELLDFRASVDASEHQNLVGIHGPIRGDDGSLGYYPAVSVYGGGQVTLNFGPRFVFAPPNDPELEASNGTSNPSDVREQPPKRTWRPMSERYPEFLVEECVWDMVDEIEKWEERKELSREGREESMDAVIDVMVKDAIED
ncbi:uncharacterized protein VTP21DRAFT_1325 [Calcarisporiella thermophila]|uniref:uncharacterized protein n=1 Tax=Calcarisporiella thermophila TaxID=911321 RepID=UPI00374304BD